MSLELYTSISEKLGAVQSQMFGKPCLKINGKAFAAFHQEKMVFKLGKEWIAENASNYPEAHNWDPSGKNRPMKDWFCVSSHKSEKWLELGQLAAKFTTN